MKTITDEKFLSLVSSGKRLTAKDRAYVERMIEAHQEPISLRTAIGLVVSREDFSSPIRESVRM
jgi:hypothetical protein